MYLLHQHVVAQSVGLGCWLAPRITSNGQRTTRTCTAVAVAVRERLLGWSPVPPDHHCFEIYWCLICICIYMASFKLCYVWIQGNNQGTGLILWISTLTSLYSELLCGKHPVLYKKKSYHWLACLMNHPKFCNPEELKLLIIQQASPDVCILHREIHACRVCRLLEKAWSKSEIKLTWNRNELPKGSQERQPTST